MSKSLVPGSKPKVPCLPRLSRDPGSHRDWKICFSWQMVIFRVYVKLEGNDMIDNDMIDNDMIDNGLEYVREKYVLMICWLMINTMIDIPITGSISVIVVSKPNLYIIWSNWRFPKSWGYPNSWMVWNGQSENHMDDLGVPTWLWKPPNNNVGIVPMINVNYHYHFTTEFLYTHIQFCFSSYHYC